MIVATVLTKVRSIAVIPGTSVHGAILSLICAIQQQQICIVELASLWRASRWWVPEVIGTSGRASGSTQ